MRNREIEIPGYDSERVIADAANEGFNVQAYEGRTLPSVSQQETKSITEVQGRRGNRSNHGFYEYPNLSDRIAAERMAGGE